MKMLLPFLVVLLICTVHSRPAKYRVFSRREVRAAHIGYLFGLKGAHKRSTGEFDNGQGTGNGKDGNEPKLGDAGMEKRKWNGNFGTSIVHGMVNPQIQNPDPNLQSAMHNFYSNWT